MWLSQAVPKQESYAVSSTTCQMFSFSYQAVQQYTYTWPAWTWWQDDRTDSRELQWGMLQQTVFMSKIRMLQWT